MILITDFDGVLCDQRKFDFSSFEYVCRQMNLKFISLKYFISLRKRGSYAEDLFVENFKCPENKLSRAISLRREWIKKNIDILVPEPTYNVVAAINKLEDRCQIFIVTKRMNIDIPLKFIKKYSLPIAAENIISVLRFNHLTNNNFQDSDSVFNVKSAMLNYLIEYYQLKQSKCYYIGDAIADYKAAENARISFCGVLTGYVKKSEFLSYGTEVCNSFSFFISEYYKNRNMNFTAVLNERRNNYER